MSNEGTSTLTRESVEHRSQVSAKIAAKRSGLAAPIFFGWLALAFFLLVTKLAGSLALPWIVVLVPIWLPIVAMVGMLLAAMWLDQIATHRHE
jgi:hypothetical protein